MRGGSASMRGVLLGLVLERPGHGGDLANRMLMRLGETWRVDTNDAYRLLEQLEREELIQSREQPRKNNERRTMIVYHPTPKTSPALTLWMETLLPREPVRFGLHAKLAVARAEDAPRLMVALRDYEQKCLALAQLVTPNGRAQRSWPALFMDCTREAVYTQLRAEIDWASAARERIAEHAARQPPR
ncbi:MAG TPA: helix-turn-helix transcriptional regulator [Solirubrobacteraceae bacterium]